MTRESYIEAEVIDGEIRGSADGYKHFLKVEQETHGVKDQFWKEVPAPVYYQSSEKLRAGLRACIILAK